MGLGAGLSNFSRGINNGLEDIEARGLRKKQDERLAAQDARQAVENQQRDTVYGQNQAQYAEQQNQLAYGKQFENAMRSYVTSQGKDLQGVQQFFNQNTVDGAKVSLSEDKDGAVAWKSINADGTIRDEKSLPKQDFMRAVFAFKDPIAFQKAAEAAEAKKAERVAEMEEWGAKKAVEDAYKINYRAREAAAALGLEGVKHKNAIEKTKLENEGRIAAEKVKAGAEGGLAKDYPITIHTPKGSFKKAFTNSDMRQTYEKIYKFPDESLRFQSPVEYDRLMRIATDNAPTYEKWLGRTIAEGLNLPEEPPKPSNYPWQQGIAPSQDKAAGLQKPQAVQSAPQIKEGSTAINPSTGQRIIYRNGQWAPAK